jgi:TetR/AcrR family transcriptional repressor of nem operon
MPYTKSHKARTRARIVETASRSFRERGVGAVGIADLMRDAGLTHGGFYAHFPSKDSLIAEATASGLADSQRAFLLESEATNPESPLREIIRRYVSRYHRDHPSEGCVMPALASEIAREPEEVRHTFTTWVERLITGIAVYCPGETLEARRDAALALTAGMVGAVALSRALDDPEFSDRILLATRRFYTNTLTAAPSPPAQS